LRVEANFACVSKTRIKIDFRKNVIFGFFEIQKAIIEQVTWNNSSILLKIILQNTQILQPFTKIIQTESIYKHY
jgi:hypothetical protein